MEKFVAVLVSWEISRKLWIIFEEKKKSPDDPDTQGYRWVVTLGTG